MKLCSCMMMHSRDFLAKPAPLPRRAMKRVHQAAAGPTSPATPAPTTPLPSPFYRPYGPPGLLPSYVGPPQRGLGRGGVGRMEDNSFLTRVNAVFMHFSKRSTIHGLNHMAQARTARRRLFWLLISVVASVGFFINLYYLIEKYVQKPVLTNVYHDYEGFIYPDITICITNPIYFPPNGTKSYKTLTKTIDDFRYFKKHNVDISNRVELADFLFMINKNMYSHPAWSSIIACKYLQNSCSYKHFEVRRVWPYGNCYTFNATKMSKKISRRVMETMRFNGFRPDFRLVVYKALDYPAEYRLDPHNSLDVPNGVLVMIHEADTYPHIGDSFIVDDCTQIDLKITTKAHMQTLNKCEPDRASYTYTDLASKVNVTFLGRQSDCIYEIVQSILPKYCGCQWQTMPVLSRNAKVPYCLSGRFNSSYLRGCLPSAFQEINQHNLQMCYRDLCNHISFTTVISHSKYPAVRERNTHAQWLETLAKMERREYEHYSRSDLWRKALLPQAKSSAITNLSTAQALGRSDLLDVEFIERNFMMLRIVPASLFMDRVEEAEEYPLSRLMSDIGGCVGLWIGASLITVFEFVDLLLDFTEVKTMRPQRPCNGTVAFQCNRGVTTPGGQTTTAVGASSAATEPLTSPALTRNNSTFTTELLDSLSWVDGRDALSFSPLPTSVPPDAVGLFYSNCSGNNKPDPEEDLCSSPFRRLSVEDCCGAEDSAAEALLLRKYSSPQTDLVTTV